MDMKDRLAVLLRGPIKIYNKMLIRRIYNEKTELEPLPKDSGRVLILSPHVDDETIGAATVMENARYDICYITDSGGGVTGSKEEREQEARNLHDALGAGKIFFLGGRNGKLAEDLPEVTSKLKTLVKDYDTVFSTGYFDNHKEHRLTAKALADSGFAGTIYLYEVSNLMPRKLVTHYRPMSEADLKKKERLFSFFPSQKSMDFDIFLALNRGKGRVVEAAGAEFFRKTDAPTLKKEAALAEPWIERDYPYRIGNHRSFYKTRKNRR